MYMLRKSLHTRHIAILVVSRRKILPLKASANLSEISIEHKRSFRSSLQNYNFVLATFDDTDTAISPLMQQYINLCRNVRQFNSLYHRVWYRTLALSCSLGSFSYVACITGRCSLRFWILRIVEFHEICIDSNIANLTLILCINIISGKDGKLYIIRSYYIAWWYNPI